MGVDGAQCNETCAAGKEGFTCDIVGHQSVPVHSILGTNLNCFAVYTKDTGSPKPSTELYLENCQNVQYGFFGHLEVISREGARVLTSNLEECHSLFAPCANEGCDWKWGAWGEDVFTQRCMDH